MNNAEIIDSFFAENPVSAATQKVYERAINRLMDKYPDLSICTSSNIRKFLDDTGWGTSLCYTASIAIKKYIRWRYGSQHPALHLRIKREDSKPGRTINKAHAETLLKSFDLATIKGKRDYAICKLALDTGLRVNELATLKFSDVNLEDQKLLVRIKGGKWKVGVFPVDVRSAIADWCNYRRPGDDRLFQVSRDGLRVIVRRWGEKCGFTLSPHDLRRSFATLSTKNGAPSRLVQLAGRWSNIAMVERYTQVLTAEDYEGYYPTSHLEG
jgi:integrase/recombinase XerD